MAAEREMRGPGTIRPSFFRIKPCRPWDHGGFAQEIAAFRTLICLKWRQRRFVEHLKYATRRIGVGGNRHSRFWGQML